MDNLYNQEFKERYLKERFPNEDSQNTIRHIFKKAKLIEDILEKDLYNFNLEEISKVMYNANPYSAGVAKSYHRAISRYISWAIKPIGIREDNLNPLKGVKPDWGTGFVDKTKKIHFTYDEMIEMVEQFSNAQDQALVWMIFEGVMGKNFHELRNLRYDTVNWNNNELVLVDEDFSERIIKVSNRCMRYIENAYKEEIYRSPSEKNKSLVRSDFILRNIESPRSKAPDISKQSIYNRIYSFKEKLNLVYFSPNAIKQSGMIYESYKIYQRDNVFDTEQFREVAEKYKVSQIYDYKGDPYPNVYLMKEYINKENLKELYNIDVNISIKVRKK